MGSITAFLIYQLAMLYGIVYLASCFYWSPPRGMPVGEFMVFGLSVPIAVWLLSMLLAPSCALLMPVSLGYLYWRAAAPAARMRLQETSDMEEEFQAADRAISRDPDNAAAYAAKAEILEKKKAWQPALECYEKAHALSDRTVTAPELDEIRERLQDEIREEQARPREQSRLTDYLAATVLELVFLVVGAALFFWNWAMGLNVVSLMLFATWCKTGDSKT
ncbi:MAG: hypothetical protein ABII00_16375 [Elusimicrobiota bacterium]